MHHDIGQLIKREGHFESSNIFEQSTVHRLGNDAVRRPRSGRNRLPPKELILQIGQKARRDYVFTKQWHKMNITFVASFRQMKPQNRLFSLVLSDVYYPVKANNSLTAPRHS